MVERRPVKARVGGSNPPPGADKNNPIKSGYFCLLRVLDKIRTYFRENPDTDF